MNSVVNIMKMDMAICRKSMLIMAISMLVAGIACLFFLTPLLLGLFVVGSTAVVSAVFAVEAKSNMEFFYGCFPIKKWEYIVGRSLTCLLVMVIPSVISIVFIQIERRFSLCRIEEVRLIMETAEEYQMILICGMIMVGFIGGANLLLAAFMGKVESREMLEVILLLLEGVFGGLIMFLVQKFAYDGDTQEFLQAFRKLLSEHEQTSCLLLLLTGLIVFAAGTLLSLKLVPKKRI